MLLDTLGSIFILRSLKIKQKSLDNSKNECMRYRGACSPLPPPPPYCDDYLSEMSVLSGTLRGISKCVSASKIVHDMTQLGTRDKSHRQFGMVRFLQDLGSSGKPRQTDNARHLRRPQPPSH